MSAPSFVSDSSMIETVPSDKIKLLLVDDDHDNLLALQAVLDPLQQELVLAQSGADALRMCLDQDFAAILLDVRMPGMDGFETAEMIRARLRSRHTPILFLTAYRSDEQLFRGYDLGAVDFLFKPIVPEILQSKVAVFVELNRTHQLLRRQAEELARTEQKFRAVLEAAPDAMLITNEAGLIELANSRTDALFVYARETLIGRDIRTLIPDWQSPEIVLDGEDGRHSIETRLRALRSNGSAFPAQITRSPFQVSKDRLITTAVRDATEQVEAEEQIKKINAELEKRVTERTSELLQSNEALRQFAWAASHDLQEPIRTVVSYSQWLAESAGVKLAEAEAKMLNVIETNGIRMHDLLSALRQYIYVSESGLQESTLVDCNVAVRTALNALQTIIEETGAKIESKPLPTIPSPDVLVLQLFQNLISNGIKYRTDRSPVICIWADEQPNGWTFTVQDNGIGVDPKYKDYIFGVFKRLHGREYAGTGIGLAICKTAVERLGGRIWVESVPGEGASFKFFVPRELSV